MKQSEFRELIHNSAHRHLRICMNDGKTYTVSHPDFALAGPNSVMLASGPGHSFGASYVICGFDHISRVEVEEKPKSKPAKP